MKNTGSYSDWSHYGSPPPPPNSNLSAFAAPFSVNPYASGDVSSHFMDSAADAEKTLSMPLPVPPNHSQSYGYDFFSSPVGEIDSNSRFPRLVLGSYGAGSSLVEAQPYHPSYSAFNDHSSSSVPLSSYHWPSSSLDWPTLVEANKSPPELGFSAQNAVSWEQFPEFNNVRGEKRFGVSSSLPPKEPNVAASVAEERINQNYGNQDVKDYVKSEVSHMIDWENHNVPPSGNHLHDTSSCWGTIKPLPVEFSGAGVMQYPLKTHPEVPLNSINNHLSNTGSYDKPSRDDTVSSMPGAELVTDLNIENIIADEHVGSNNFCNTKEAYHVPSPGTAGSCFDSGHLRMHLGRNEPSSSNKAMTSDNNLSRDMVDYICRGYGFQNPQANMDNLNLRLSATEDVNFVGKSFESGDRCNPAEDSPCWKGASANHFSVFDPSVLLPLPLPPHYVHKEGFGSVIQEPQNYVLNSDNNLKKSCEKTSSVGSPRKFLIPKFASKECKSGGAVNGGPFQSKPNSDFGLQFLDVIKMKEMMESSVTPAEPTDCESESSCTEHQVIEENKLMSPKQHTSCTGDADVGCNVSKCLESGIPHPKESALSSLSLVVDTTTTPENSAGKVSTERLNVQMLVDTMQNLSELLLNCELKERDCNILKNVISNLNTCACKNAEQIAPAQECLLNQLETSKCAAGEPNEIQQNASLKKPQLTNIGPASSKVEFENPLVAEENLHFMFGKPFGKPHKNLSDSVSPRDDTEMTKADNMTKDLKRILVENFHDDDDEGAEPQTVLYKNLWLEAEAALCSVYYRARYNQMKIEMDKYSCKEKEMEKQSKSEVVPTLSQSQSSAAEMHNYSDPDSPALKLPVLNTTNLEELSCLNLFTDMKKPNTMTAEGKGGQNLDSFIDNYAVCCSDKEAERKTEASFMARYQVLKARVDHPCIDSTNQEEPLEIAEKSAPRGMDNQNQVNLCQDSPIPENNSTDYAASVVARFHILKSRIEGSSSISSEGTLIDGVGSAGKGMDDTTIAKDETDGDVHVNPAVVHLNSYTALDKSIPKLFHLDLEDSQENHPWGFQIPSCNSDGLASDWEHVEKSL